MMGSKRRRVVSCVEEDRISNLPEHLIDSILDPLPVEDVVRTSILSRKWRHKWTKMRALVFDEHFFKRFEKNNKAFGRKGYIRIINKVMILHQGPISKFVLHVPKTNIFPDIFEEVDQWMIFLSRNGVSELIITNLNQHYKLPSYLFSCIKLTKLELKNCSFNPPLEFEGFLNLEELSFNGIDFGTNMCGTKINLPQLKKLSLHACTNAYNFNIKTTKLQILVVVACPDAMLLRLSDSPCLIVAVIYLRKPIKDFVRVEKMDLTRMLSNLSMIKNFSINSHFLKFLIAEHIPKFLPHAIDSLKSLCFFRIQLGDLDQLCGVLCLLRSSPNLQKLRIYMKEPLVDVGPASSQLESPNCLDCTLNKLQTVEITDLDGSKPELLFIKFLLAHSPSLKKLTIRPTGASDVKKRFDIAKDVMQFSRGSTEGKIFFLDPRP